MGRKPQKLLDRFWKYIDKRGVDECWPWIGARTSRGYGQIKADGTLQMLSSHRVSWSLENGPIPDGMIICHKCDNPPCCNPDHLFLGTHDINAKDRDAKGRNNFLGNAKLTADQAAEIRGAVGTQWEIARRFGVTQSSVSLIKLGKIWKDAP